MIASAQGFQHDDASAYFCIGSAEGCSDNGAMAVQAEHFQELAIFVSGPGAVH